MKTRPLDFSNFNKTEYPIEELFTQDHYDLINAVEEDNLTEVKRILDTGINPNFVIQEDPSEFLSPLAISVCALNLPITQTLLEYKADPNIKLLDKEQYLYLMQIEEDTNNCNESNEKSIFLYRNADKIFFRMNGEHELDVSTLLPLLEDEKFDQPKTDPKKCKNKKLHHTILEMTANNRSMVEILMLGISKLDQAVTSEIEKRPLKLFGKNTPFKVKIILTPKKIQDAHKILDLLLCYGLKRNFEWSRKFQKSIEQLSEALIAFYLTNIKQKAIPELLKQGMKKGIQRTLLSGLEKCLLYLIEYKNSSPKNNFQDYTINVLTMKRSVQGYADEIEDEKNYLLNEYRTKIADGSPILPIALVDIIIHYAISSFTLNQEVALTRQAENRTLEFWHKPKIDGNKIGLGIEMQIEYLQYERATRHLKDLIGNEARQILISYLAENPDELELSSNQTLRVGEILKILTNTQ